MRWTVLNSAMTTVISVMAAVSQAHSPSSPSVGTIVVDASSSPLRPDVFGTLAIDAGVTPYGARWRRVSAADASDPRIRALGEMVSETSLDPVERLAVIQRLVARRVLWRRDLDIYRVADYWAQAGETLSRGEGDSEDIAVLKMQILKAAGYSARDIYLSIGRDPDRGVDSILLVRVGGEFYSLDDREARPSLAGLERRFAPVFTLGQNSAWIHGKRVATRALTASRRVSLPRPTAR